MRRAKHGVPIVQTVCAVTVVSTVVVLAGYVRREQSRIALNRLLAEGVRTQDVAAVALALRTGADPNAPGKPVEMRSCWRLIEDFIMHKHIPRSYSALTCAVEPVLYHPDSPRSADVMSSAQTVEIVNRLLECGADVNYRDQVGNTALNYAAAFADPQMTVALLSHGANPDNCNDVAETPLMEAAAEDRGLVVKALLGRHADVNKSSIYGKTALIYAAGGPDESIDLLNDLIAAGADVRASDKSGATAVAYARHDGAWKKLHLLLAAGAR